MVESMRLDRDISCPECCFAVKPFVIERVVKKGATPRGDRPAVKVQCPRNECQHTFFVYGDDGD